VATGRRDREGRREKGQEVKRGRRGKARNGMTII
jgi:hypothetical protein